MRPQAKVPNPKSQGTVAVSCSPKEKNVLPVHWTNNGSKRGYGKERVKAGKEYQGGRR
jgi:hypothetical protein